MKVTYDDWSSPRDGSYKYELVNKQWLKLENRWRTSTPRNGEATWPLTVFDDDDPLEPVDSVFASSAEKVCQCLPEGRLDVVEVGEKGEIGL